MNLLQLLVIGLSSLLLSIGSGILPQSVTQRISQVVPHVVQVPNPDANISRNWSGYTAANGTFTGVSGTWTVPKVDGGTNYGADATWVGIGGVNTTDLIQAGTQAMVDRDGQVSYEAFYETLPDISRPLQIPVSAGDSITASVTNKGNSTWEVSLKNNTKNQSVEFATSYDSSLSSAEWIEEAPTGMRQTLPLDNFGTVQFTDATAIKDGKTVGLSDTSPQAITMGDMTGQMLATTSNVGNDGNSFSISRTSTDGTQAGVTFAQIPHGVLRIHFHGFSFQ